MKKLNLILLFGGMSFEHKVSIKSAKSVYDNIDANKYNVFLIKIDIHNNWILYKNNSSSFEKITKTKGEKISLIKKTKPCILNLNTNQIETEIDVVFPVTHGINGEDGRLQGFLKMLDIPFVGPGILSSAVCINKSFTKQILSFNNILNSKFIILENNILKYEKVVKSLGKNFFIKPNRLGSSIGVKQVKNEKEYIQGVKKCFEYGKVVILEEYIKGREIECSVLGNSKPKASIPGEVLLKKGFYSYTNKYGKQDNVSLIIPAKLTKEQILSIQKIALKTYTTLACKGMARVDVFLKENGDIYVNEVNTLPGFTQISMYPKLWEKTGIPYTKLIDKLINLAIKK